MSIKHLTRLGLAVFVGGGLVACDEDSVGTDQTTGTPYVFDVRIENVSPAYDFFDSGVFAIPRDASAPGPLFPGEKYEFEFNAGVGQYLSFATMMVQSNDLFFAPDEMGIPLYVNGQQNLGDVTKYVQLWDAGTEADGEPGLGMDQAPRQSGPNTGAADPNNTVRLADNSFGNIPDVASLIKVVIETRGPQSFYVSIENLSDGMTLMTSDGGSHPVPLAPGVYVVHTAPAPLFTVGAPDRGEGLEGVAEDGNTSALGASIASRTGVTSPLAPGVFGIHYNQKVLFTTGQPDRGLGLEGVAEDGNAGPLSGAVAATPGIGNNGVFNTPEGAAGPGPLFPGQAYTFTVEGEDGDRLHFATMYVQSNDLFFAPSDDGLALFNNGVAINGDVTSQIYTYDAGTEVDEIIGIGPNQAPRQAGPNTGADENGNVRIIDHVNAVGNIKVIVTSRPR